MNEIIGLPIIGVKGFPIGIRRTMPIMNTFGERLKACRKEKGMAQQAVAKLVGMAQGTLSELENDEYPTSAFTPQLASLYGVRAMWLAEGRGPRTDKDAHSNVILGLELRQVPLISWVAASDFAHAVDNFQPGHGEELIDTTIPVHQHTYALRVDGPSMTRPGGEEDTFPHGCVIIVEPNLIDSPEKLVNRYVIVRRHNEDTATFKQLIRDGGRFILHPLNPQFENLGLRDDDAFCGVVRGKAHRRLV